MMAMVSELSMHQATAMKLQQEVNITAVRFIRLFSEHQKFLCCVESENLCWQKRVRKKVLNDVEVF